MFTEASLDSLFGLWCSDYVYHGKNEKDILAGRQSAVEEILWCVIHATLEGHQSTGQAEQRPPFLKCHQGVGARFSAGPRSGFQRLRDEMVSQARRGFRWPPFPECNSVEAWVVAVPHLLSLAVLWPAVSGKHDSWSEGHWKDFNFSFILTQSSSFLFHSSATCMSKTGVRVLDLQLFL